MQKAIILELDEWKKIERVLEDARFIAENAKEGRYKGEAALLAYDVGPLVRHIQLMDGTYNDGN